MILLTGSVRIALTLLVAGFAGVLLVRLAPGFGTDERELNAHMSGQSIAALRAGRDANVGRIYYKFLSGVAHGDFGTSESLSAPVAGLLAERLPLTLRSAGLGLGLAWASALLVAALAGGFAPEELVASPSVPPHLLALPAKYKIAR